ncbi:MAG: hypothetical protein ACH37Z_09950 [Anaerolineae bacterium]|jgi:hypothetical protein|nr:hypothetical protein [Ardenticatenia bacterium]MBK8539216.1 hypothetical protein [Ardenticatenia bacterium]HQZ71672.1 hypothetical protein [Anaerolineae bacterium]HRA20466.1 hypothetical protein [Anaerolineae bacterium]
MNPMNPTFDLKAFGESLQAGREAWQGGMKLWSETLLQASKTNLELALGLREQYGTLLGQAMERGQTAFTQEQALMGQWSQALQGQGQSQMELVNKMSANLLETGRGLQKQAQAAGSQVADMLNQATEATMATVEEVGARANGTTRARAR